MTAREREDWSFWLRSLAGEKPETTPGSPHQGFFLIRQRRSWPDPVPNVGESRRRVATHKWPVAIWRDEYSWRCLITQSDKTTCLSDTDVIDNIFARCCREPIAHERYLQIVKEIEEARS